MNKPTVLTIFGGTGDLTFRKLLPALYSMEQLGNLHEQSRILIVGRRDYTDEAYSIAAKKWVEQFARMPFDEGKYKIFSDKIHYLKMDFTDLDAYEILEQYFNPNIIQEQIYYFAVAPRFFGVIADGIRQITGAKNGKIILEKPFGENLDDAKALNNRLENVFSPEHIYRIDHYLGKEMVRGIAAIRFTNPIFNYVWDARQIEYIEISAAEKEGVKNRGGYYDSAGALQDMVQNHLFQILSILAMERPAQFYGTDMHSEQLKVLHALRHPGEAEIGDALVLGQYEGYREESSVPQESKTETYASLQVFVDNDRWRNMPFYIRTGKNLKKREMKVKIAFRRMAPELPMNLLIIHIQPSEGVYLRFNMKKPGETDEITEAHMDFCQSCIPENQENTPEAYERLLYACMQGERYWFSQWDQIEAGWKYVENLKKLAGLCNLPVLLYKPGSDGPEDERYMKE